MIFFLLTENWQAHIIVPYAACMQSYTKGFSAYVLPGSLPRAPSLSFSDSHVRG